MPASPPSPAPRRPKVFVVNKAGHDFSDAERYGDLIYVTEGPQMRFNTTSMYRIWAEALQDNKSKSTDYILITSLNILCAVGAAVFGRKHGRLNLLLYKGGARSRTDPRGRYVSREILLDDILEFLELPDTEAFKVEGRSLVKRRR